MTCLRCFNIAAVCLLNCILVLLQILLELSSESDQREDGDGAETQEEFGVGIKFTFDSFQESEDFSSSESEEESSTATKEINLLYIGETSREKKARKGKENDVADGTEAIDSLWLQKQVCGCLTLGFGLLSRFRMLINVFDC